MKIYFLSMGSGTPETASIFASEADMKAWLPAHAASCYCGEYMGGKPRTRAEQMEAFLDGYEFKDTPKGRWAAAIAWAAEEGREEWAIGVRETDHVDAEGNPVSPLSTFTIIDKAYAKKVRR